MKAFVLRYAAPAEDSILGWERQSLPLGNGYMGANVFGRYDRERIQFTSNRLQNPLDLGGTTSFADMYIDLGHENVENYERGLNLNRGVAYCRYNSGGTHYEREYFTSYPDDLLAVRLTADKPTLSFSLSLSISYLGERAPEEGGKEGSVKNEKGDIILRGRLCSRDLIFEAQAALYTDGERIDGKDGIEVKNATFAEIYYLQGTSYKLCPEVFLETDFSKKALGDDPHEALSERLAFAKGEGYASLYNRHFADYNELFGRVSIDLGGKAEGYTDELLAEYRKTADNRYIEELYFQFGRYLLIASSRKGTSPSSLQGVWSAYDKTPWSGGFWHNINIQMNYWPAFSCNLAETFPAYAEFYKAYRPVTEKLASEFLKTNYPEGYVEGEGECGWLIPTACNSYEIAAEGSEMEHSGPGTVGMTSKLFWEYYDFTRDESVLKELTYPALRGAAQFLTKCVKEYSDGVCRAAISASPEQIVGAAWVTDRKHNQFYYHTVGCAFDQQMIYENGLDFLKAAELLGKEDDELYRLQKSQIDRYAPVRIGYSGQIKEYEEEHFYGEIGELHHRHISQLMSLVPGSVIGSATPAWLDAAKKTLELRGDMSTGWALAHRLCAWARTGEGDRAHILFKNLLQNRTYDNLWDWHPPFQIDGNFGGTTGVAEMLLQSHEGYINILPTLPTVWHTGAFSGLKARGNFTVDCNWEKGRATEIKITAPKGGEVKIRYKGIGKAKVFCDGKEISPVSQDDLFITFNTEAEKTYTLSGFEELYTAKAPTDLSYRKKDGKVGLCWLGVGELYRVYCARDDESDYILLAETADSSFTYSLPDEKAVYSFKVTALYKDMPLSESTGALITLHPADELQLDRYTRHINKISQYG